MGNNSSCIKEREYSSYTYELKEDFLSIICEHSNSSLKTCYDAYYLISLMHKLAHEQDAGLSHYRSDRRVFEFVYPYSRDEFRRWLTGRTDIESEIGRKVFSNMQNFVTNLTQEHSSLHKKYLNELSKLETAEKESSEFSTAFYRSRREDKERQLKNHTRTLLRLIRVERTFSASQSEITDQSASNPVELALPH